MTCWRAAPVSLVHAQPEIQIEADRFRIEQVVLNLLSNAIKYGCGSPVEVQLRQSAQHAELQVRDFGRGIAPADQERVFQRL